MVFEQLSCFLVEHEVYFILHVNLVTCGSDETKV